MWEPLVQALDQLSQPANLLVLAVGAVAGLILGALPGLFLAGLTIGMTFTFGWEPGTAMFLMAGMMGAATEGGSVPAILLNIPGEAPNAATCFDGHPMARRGEAGPGRGACRGLVLPGRRHRHVLPDDPAPLRERSSCCPSVPPSSSCWWSSAS